MVKIDGTALPTTFCHLTKGYLREHNHKLNMNIESLVQRWYDAVDDGKFEQKIQRSVSELLGLGSALFLICGLVLATVIRGNINHVLLWVCVANIVALLIGLCASFIARDKIQLYAVIFGPVFFFLVEWGIL